MDLKKIQAELILFVIKNLPSLTKQSENPQTSIFNKYQKNFIFLVRQSAILNNKN